MKKLLFLLLMAGIFSVHSGYAADSMEGDNISFVLRGRPAGEEAVMSIAKATNMTTFPVRFIPDYTIGNQYVLELYRNGDFVYGRNFIVSNQLIRDVSRHKSNPATAESINQICMTQATAMQDVFRRGLELEKAILRDLAEQANQKSGDSCNSCPRDPDLQDNYNNRIGGLDDGRIYVSDDYLRRNSGLDYDRIVTNSKVEKKWFGKNWWWVIPASLLVGYLAADYFSDGTVDGNFTKVTKITIYEPSDPNNPNNPGHNPNAVDFLNRPVTNTALDAGSQFAIGSSGGLVIGIGW